VKEEERPFDCLRLRARIALRQAEGTCTPGRYYVRDDHKAELAFLRAEVTNGAHMSEKVRTSSTAEILTEFEDALRPSRLTVVKDPFAWTAAVADSFAK
jgi:hypothetical protein